MRNVFSLQLETKVSLAIVLIAVIFFLLTAWKSLDNFNKFIDRINIEQSGYEKIRIQTNP